MSNSSRTRVAWCGIISHSFLISLLSFLFSRLDIYLFVLLYFLLYSRENQIPRSFSIPPSFFFYFFFFFYFIRLVDERHWDNSFLLREAKTSGAFLFFFLLGLSLFSRKNFISGFHIRSKSPPALVFFLPVCVCCSYCLVWLLWYFKIASHHRRRRPSPARLFIYRESGGAVCFIAVGWVGGWWWAVGDVSK